MNKTPSKTLTKARVEQVLNEVFAKLYPGWSPSRLHTDPEHLTVIGHMDSQVPTHPALALSNKRAKTLRDLNDLAQQGKTRAEAAATLGMNYSHVSSLATAYGIPFRRAPYGSSDRYK